MQDNPLTKSSGEVPITRNVKYIESSNENTTIPTSPNSSVKKILQVESLSLLNVLGKEYFSYESEDYVISDDGKVGFFVQQPDNIKSSLFRFFYHTLIRCEIFYIFGYRMTLFDIIFVPMLLWASRRISGIAGAENENGLIDTFV